jgi:hypothetical protein
VRDSIRWTSAGSASTGTGVPSSTREFEGSEIRRRVDRGPSDTTTATSTVDGATISNRCVHWHWRHRAVPERWPDPADPIGDIRKIRCGVS